MQSGILRQRLAACAGALWLVFAPARADGLAAQRFIDLAGRPVAPQALRGHVSIVNFWATWCAPCRQEMPMLNALRAKLHPGGTEVVGIALDDRAAVTGFVSALKIGYPVWLDREDTLALMRELGNARGVLPFTVLLDRQGRPLARFAGTLDESALRAALRDAR